MAYRYENKDLYMYKFFIALFLLCLSLQAEEQLEISQKGKLLYEENFEEITKRLKNGKSVPPPPHGLPLRTP